MVSKLPELSGWGRYPRLESYEKKPSSAKYAEAIIKNSFHGIPRGLGRSYGDSSLYFEVIATDYLNNFISFDASTGVLCCEAGVTLRDITQTFSSRGWFPHVTPGTQFVTVGGAIASDVHGKNHHREGSFCDYVTQLLLLTPSGEVIVCSRDERPELFHATCGGMGLTGVILSASIRLKRIDGPFIDETIFKASHVEEVLDLFDSNGSATYSVAWIDCVTSGRNLGRSLLMMGEHSFEKMRKPPSNHRLCVPFECPSFLLSKYTVSLFNALYYRKIRGPVDHRLVSYEHFFYPLDAVENWNRIYGEKGFLQYQFVIPFESGRKGLPEILSKIVQSKRGSFLAVLKLLGEENFNYLSFPMKGYTLAVDFKMSGSIFTLLSELDEMVLDYGGRVYLTKDARMTAETFRRGYPRLNDFLKVKEAHDGNLRFKSLQSERLNIGYE